MTAVIPDPGCDCDECRGARVTALQHRLRTDVLEQALQDAYEEIARLEGDLAVAADVAFCRGHVLRAIKPLVGVLPPVVTGASLAAGS